MVIGLDISCGDFKLHWDWSPFALWSKVTNVVQVTWSCNCSVHMSPPLSFIFGLATSFVLEMISIFSNIFCNIKNSSPSSKWIWIQKGVTFLLLPKLVKPILLNPVKCKGQDSWAHGFLHLVFSSPKFPKHLFYLFLNRKWYCLL